MHFYVNKKFKIFFTFNTFWPKYNLDLRAYGQLLSLFNANWFMFCYIIASLMT